jgi:hypothetical protein
MTLVWQHRPYRHVAGREGVLGRNHFYESQITPEEFAVSWLFEAAKPISFRRETRLRSPASFAGECWGRS